MWLLLKNYLEIEEIIKNNTEKKEKLVKVSQEKEKPLWYASHPLKKNYTNYIDYIKDMVLFVRTHNSWSGNYFWKIEFKKEITNNYWKYAYMKKWHYGYIVEGEIKFNRHLILSQIFKHNKIANIVHNFPPSIFKYIFILYVAHKYKLDSYEVWWMRKTEVNVWKYIYNIEAMEDWDYLIFKNSNNFRISSIVENQK